MNDMTAKIRAALAREISETLKGGGLSDDAADAVLALVKPKPLAWVWNGEMHRSKSINGVYRVVKTANKANDKYMVIFLDAECRSYTLGYVDGQEAAQAAAQSHADAVHWSGMVLADMIGGE